MTRIRIFTLFALLFFTLAAHAQCPVPPTGHCYFYGGDLDFEDMNQNALSNEEDPTVPTAVTSPYYGAATFQNFVVPPGPSITVIGLSTNNLSSLTPISGYWEIRSGMSSGHPGTLIAHGIASGSNWIWSLTGRTGYFGYDEYTGMALGLNVHLTPGTYWFAVVPKAHFFQNGRSFNSNTDGRNAVGTALINDQFFNSVFFRSYFINANSTGCPSFSGTNSCLSIPGVFRIFSSAVYVP